LTLVTLLLLLLHGLLGLLLLLLLGWHKHCAIWHIRSEGVVGSWHAGLLLLLLQPCGHAGGA
jgi:hypothetical protein